MPSPCTLEYRTCVVWNFLPASSLDSASVPTSRIQAHIPTSFRRRQRVAATRGEEGEGSSLFCCVEALSVFAIPTAYSHPTSTQRALGADLVVITRDYALFRSNVRRLTLQGDRKPGKKISACEVDRQLGHAAGSRARVARGPGRCSRGRSATERGMTKPLIRERSKTVRYEECTRIP